jgi:hypothetical protein
MTAMSPGTKKGLKIAAGTIVAALVIAFTVNVAVDFWTPQAELKTPAMKDAATPVSPSAMQVPKTAELPAPPAPQQTTAASAQPWAEPLFDPKFDAPGLARSGGARQSYTAPDFGSVLKPSIPLSQVSPPSFVTPGSEPNVISIKPIFNSKAGGVDSGAAGAVGGTLSGASGAVSGATSGASSLLKR